MRNLIPVLLMSIFMHVWVPAVAGKERNGRAVDSIKVPEQYRIYFENALAAVFGAASKNFTYSDAGHLLFEGKPSSLPRRERAVFNQISALMKEETITNIIYEAGYWAKTKNNDSFYINTAEYGGEGTALVKLDTALRENYIVVDPAAKSPITVYEVTDSFYIFKGTGTANSPRQFTKNTNVQVNPNILTWHGLGHVIFAGKTLDNVIDFDNLARKLYKTRRQDGTYMDSAMHQVNYDEWHNKTIKVYVR